MQNNKYWFFGSKLNTVLLLILIILMVVALRWMWHDKQKYLPSLNQTPAENSEQPIKSNINVSTDLPKYIGTMAVGAGWPPVISTSSTAYSCASDKSEMSTTVEKIINGNKYCITSFIDAAMSHRGGQYAYTKANGNGTKIANFSLYWVSCPVYQGSDNSEYNECQSNQDTFFSNLDSLIDSLMK